MAQNYYGENLLSLSGYVNFVLVQRRNETKRYFQPLTINFIHQTLFHTQFFELE